jgi:hypothetical protein
VVGGKKAVLQPFFFNIKKLEDATAASSISISFADGTPTTQHNIGTLTMRATSVQELQARILEIQWVGANQLSQLVPGKRTFLDLSGDAQHDRAASATNVPRFSLTVVDSHVASKTGGCAGGGRCAAFVIPQGREHDWIFSSEEGQMELAEKTGYQRLIVIQLNHGHMFTDMKAVQDELSGKVMQLVPANFTDKLPFLTLGEEGVGKRRVIYNGTSQYV